MPGMLRPAQAVRHTQDELGSPGSSQSCMTLGVDGMNSTPGMLAWRGQAGQVGERFDDTALTVSDDGGEPLDEDQGIENRGDAAVAYP